MASDKAPASATSIDELLAWLRTRLPADAGAAACEIAASAPALAGEEAALVPNAREPRRLEFAAGRAAARAALRRLGLESGPILARPERDPIWPDGVAGSITHTRGWALAATARGLGGLGLDLEGDEPLEPRVAARVCRLDELAGEPELAKLRFVAKEAFYKAVFPRVRRWIGFDEVRVEVDASTGRFLARYLGESALTGAPHEVAGDYAFRPGLICALCVW